MSEYYVKESQQAIRNTVMPNIVVDGDHGKQTHDGILLALAKAGYQPKIPKGKYRNIVITAGHGGRDSGAVNGHITESHIACEMRNMIAHYLTRGGANVITDGENHDNLPLKKALKLVKSGDIAIEIHTNAAYDKRAKGVEALARSDDRQICQKLCNAVASVLKTTVRGDGGWKSQSSGQHKRLAYVGAGGIILELFFITNPVELQRYQERKWLIAKTLADVLLES